MNVDETMVVALGSNLAGDHASSEALLDAALAVFPHAGLPVLRRSSWWRSAAWPDSTAPDYRNGVALVEARLGPRQALEALFEIERAFGRQRGARNQARTLDLDLIAHGRTMLDEAGLILPHPRAHQRLFVMGPLAEVAPDWRHPLLGATAQDLAASATVGRDASPA